MLITQGSLVRAQLDPPNFQCEKPDGGLAQLGEHLLCKQGVVGSIPSSSTNHFELREPKRKDAESVFACGLSQGRLLIFNKTEEGKVFRRDERRNMGM